jgi:hypothetical protein
MVADVAMEARRPGAAGAADAAPEAAQLNLLDRLELGPIGTRAPAGSVVVRRREAAGCFLYGPYLHLPEGRYRLGFRCRRGAARRAAQPLLGVEIIVLSRFQQGWRDFTAVELADGLGSLDFAVTAEHSLEGENEGRFEFRFFHLGNADLTIDAVTLDRLGPLAAPPIGPRRWRLLGRLQKSWRGRRGGDGRVAIRRRVPAGCLLYGGWPYLRLPRGRYRLIVKARCRRPRRADRPVLSLAVLGQSRWLSQRRWMRLLRRPEPGGVEETRREVTAGELAAGPVTLEFTVPTELSLEAGADAPFDIRLDHLGNAGLAIDAIDLVKLDDAPMAPPAAPRLRPAGRRRLVMIGNCQTETLRQGFAHIEALSRAFEVRYHFIQLPNNLLEFAASDLETCDILAIQDIQLWESFPLRDAVRPGADQVRFPLVRFSSLWPFDAWNGPGDKTAHDREGPNLLFPYLDGLLGRLRKEMPDREARFAAYRDLNLPGLVNYRRLHDLEVRRLAAMDDKFGIAIGAFTLGNFRQRRVFHTTVRPNWEVFNLLLQCVAKAVGARGPIALNESIDASLRNPQVPIHPRVAHDLGVAWVNQGTRYLNRGVEITWEAYIRSYIEHYG